MATIKEVVRDCQLMPNANLPASFSFRQSLDLTRLGRDFDGGYLVQTSDIFESDLLVSLGISDDWSFEKDFYEKTGAPVIAVDGSIDESIFWRSIIKVILRFDKPHLLFQRFKVLLDYKRFFSIPGVSHEKKFVGFTSESGDEFASLSEIVPPNIDKLFLKIDIEGSEYRILSEILSLQTRISGLVIEFHDVDIHLRAIEEFLFKTSLEVVHIHVNNYCPVRAPDNLPTVVEITFSSDPQHSLGNVLPHSLDMPNCESRAEYRLHIATNEI